MYTFLLFLWLKVFLGGGGMTDDEIWEESDTEVDPFVSVLGEEESLQNPEIAKQQSLI